MLRPYDYRNRDYDPYLGRFLRPGTIGPWGDPTNLGNAYAYVGNNPWSRLDPDGLATEEEFDARIWSGDHNELAKLPLSLSANLALQDIAKVFMPFRSRGAIFPVLHVSVVPVFLSGDVKRSPKA